MLVTDLLPKGTTIVSDAEGLKAIIGGTSNGIKKGDTFSVTPDTTMTKTTFKLRGETEEREYYTLNKVVDEKLVSFNMGHLRRSVPTNAQDVKIDGESATPTAEQLGMVPGLENIDRATAIKKFLQGKTITVTGILTYTGTRADGVTFTGKKGIITVV